MGMKVCMIGCGSFAQLCHGPAQRKLGASYPDVTLAACCDTAPASSLRYREAFGFERHYADAREMLSAEKPDAVILAVPPVVTCAAASAVLELGFPLLLEKPPGMTPVELGRLIAAGEKGGAGAQVGFNRHYMPVMRRAQEILGESFRTEAVGRIGYEMVRFERWDPDFSTTAIHALDGALFLARSPFRTVEIGFQAQRRGHLEATDVTVSAECYSGTRVMVEIQPVSSANSESARIDAGSQSLILRIPVSPQSDGDGSVEHWRNGALVSSYSDRSVGAVERLGILSETEAFLNSVRSGGPFSPRLQDCQQQVALMDAIRNRRSGPIRFGEG
jgi:myo-inositol 2-dehydrogenase/D-chiro-inositol 1-dehydrogenase